MAEDMNELREAAATPLPAAIEVDDDIANVPQATGNTGSPTKRTRWDERPAGPGITLADLTAALAPLAAGMRDLQKEGFKDMRARMSAVEEQVTAKVGQALDMVKTLNDRQQAQSNRLDKLQAAVEEQQDRDRSQEDIKEVLRRIDFLESGQTAGAVWRPQFFEGDPP